MGFSHEINSKPRWLKRNHGCGRPSEFCFVGVSSAAYPGAGDPDVESRYLRCFHAEFLRREGEDVSRNKIVTGCDSRLFWDAVVERGRKRTPLWILMHDVPSVFTWLDGWRALRFGRLGFEWREVRAKDRCAPDKKARNWTGLFIDNDPPVVLQLWTERTCKVFIVDLRNYFNERIDKLASRLGRFLRRPPNNLIGDERPIRYAKAECGVIRDTFLRLMDDHSHADQGTWGLTGASLAWRSFRHAHYRSNVELHGRDDVKALERESFMGGKVTCNRIGKFDGEFFQLDVNGLYPYLMRNCDLPCKLISAWNFNSCGKIAIDALGENHIARVLLNSPHETFPVRVEKRGLCFARGKFWTTLAGPELRRAVDAGVVRRLGKWACYQRENVFRPFVDYWTERRAAARERRDPIGAAFAKQVAVSLFGRFGLRSYKWRSLTRTHKLPDEWRGLTDSQILKWIWLTEGDDGRRISIVDFHTNDRSEIRRVGNHWQIAEPPHEIPTSFPAIPSFVTSYGREYMRSLELCALPKYVLYTSTDSMIVEAGGMAMLRRADMIHETKLGKLKIEAEGKSVEILTAHHYRIGRKRKRGNEATARIDGIHADDGEVIADRLQTLIRTGQNGTVNRRRVRVNRQLAYRRGVVAPDGTVSPLILGDS